MIEEVTKKICLKCSIPKPLEEFYRWKHSKNPEKYLWRAAKERAAKFSIPFDISVKDIVIPIMCPILKVPMLYGTRYAPSLDKIIPSLGYVRGNIQVVSRKANSMKLDATSSELSAFAEYFINLKN